MAMQNIVPGTPVIDGEVKPSPGIGSVHHCFPIMIQNVFSVLSYRRLLLILCGNDMECPQFQNRNNPHSRAQASLRSTPTWSVFLTPTCSVLLSPTSPVCILSLNKTFQEVWS